MHIEYIDIVERMNFNLGNAIKYICIHASKRRTTSTIDLEEAKWYIQREINRIKKD